MNYALVKKRGGFIQLSLDGGPGLPRQLLQELEHELTYTKLEHQFGGASYDPTGRRTPVIAEPRRLFMYDQSRLFCCQKGYLPRIRDKLAKHGLTMQLEDMDPAIDESVYAQDWDRIVNTFEFRPRQDECLVAIASSDGGIVDAITAFGKMYVIGMVCCLYSKAKIDIVTKSVEIAKSIQRLLTKWLPNIGLVGGGSKKKRRVTIYVAKSLPHTDYEADIVLADEVHELATDDFAASLSRYWKARMYGFTASKETRSDNAHHRLEGLFGPTIFYIGYPEGLRLGLVPPIVVRWSDINMSFNPVNGCNNPIQKKKAGIWCNEYRNQVIASSVMPDLQAGKQVLIAVETIEHAVNLKRYLPWAELCYAEGGLTSEARHAYIQAGMLNPSEPEMTPMRREWLRVQFEERQIMLAIANSIWSTGVSFNSLDVQVRAEGTASETRNIQVPGRVTRLADGKTEGTVRDYMDNFDSNFKNSSLGRRRSYAVREWTQYLPSGHLYSPRRKRGG